MTGNTKVAAKLQESRFFCDIGHSIGFAVWEWCEENFVGFEWREENVVGFEWCEENVGGYQSGSNPRRAD